MTHDVAACECTQCTAKREAVAAQRPIKIGVWLVSHDQSWAQCGRCREVTRKPPMQRIRRYAAEGCATCRRKNKSRRKTAPAQRCAPVDGSPKRNP